MSPSIKMVLSCDMSVMCKVDLMTKFYDISGFCCSTCDVSYPYLLFCNFNLISSSTEYFLSYIRFLISLIDDIELITYCFQGDYFVLNRR